MNVPHKDRWKATASSGDPRSAIDDRYATTWKSKPAKKPWLKIDTWAAFLFRGRRFAQWECERNHRR
jgi:hypothetical protein